MARHEQPLPRRDGYRGGRVSCRCASKKSFTTVGVEPAPVRDARDIEQVITTFAEEPQGGLIVLPGSSRLDNRDLRGG